MTLSGAGTLDDLPDQKSKNTLFSDAGRRTKFPSVPQKNKMCSKMLKNSFYATIDQEKGEYLVQESVAGKRPWSLDDLQRLWSFLKLPRDRVISAERPVDQNQRERRTVNGQSFKKFSAAGVVGGAGSSSYTSTNCFLTPIQCRRYGRSGTAMVRTAN
uniref:Uncharacterized protein n=1 Tax=Romanomermis culicivorax TaxID=13658 RepID=A0A915JN77_ROMCU